MKVSRPRPRRLASLLSSTTLAAALVGCGKDDIDVAKGNEPFIFFLVRNFDSCLENLRACLEQDSAPNPATLAPGIRLVRLEPTSRVFQPVDLANIRPSDRRTLAGAGFFSAVKTLAAAREIASKAGFAQPDVVNVDANCSLPYSQNNAFFRASYGFPSETGEKPTELRNVLCLGQLHTPKGAAALAADPYVVAHEYFHALFAHAILGPKNALPDVALTMSHDLDALNEGAADFFAEQVTKGTVNRIFADAFPWRSSAGRKGQPPGLSGNVYRDGTRYTEFFSSLGQGSEGLKALGCTLRTIGAQMQAAKRQVDKLDKLADERDSVGHLKFNHMEAWGYSFSSKDIETAIRACLPASEEARAKVNAQFPSAPAPLASEAEVFALIVPSLRAMCGFQRIYGLTPNQVRRGLFVDACSGAIEATIPGGRSLTMGREEIDAFSMARWLFHSVYVIPGVRLKDGSGADCRLETATLFSGGEVSMTTVTDDPRQPLKAFINMQAAEHDGRRGSWYRDVPLGDFLSPIPGESYDLSGPLTSPTAEGFRFTSMPTVGGKPQNGLHGYFWTPVDDLAVEPRAEKHALLAEWVRKTLSPYKINPEGYKACTATSPCEETQNVELVCRSHREATDPGEPDKPSLKRIRFVDVKVGVFDCKDESEDSCSLQTF